jgi:soluble lytic murein transglycosylase-like protein
MTALARTAQGLRTFASDVAQGFFEITHNGFALVGLAVVFCAIGLTARADFRATAANPQDLPKQQAAVAYWLSKKYRVAPEPLSALVAEAYDIGERAKLDPTLILAVMAIESGFNPFAQSSVGAQGLMQVMTGVHSDKYENFGGKLAAFDPVANLRVGVKVLQECIQRAGSLQAGLKFYVGAANLGDDGGYADKVMAEHARLKQVASGRNVPLPRPSLIRTVTPINPEAAPAEDKVAAFSMS